MLLVVAGVALHDTSLFACCLRAAYFQRQSGTKLEVATDITQAILQVNPPFDPSAPGGSTRIIVPVDTTYGSAHAVIPIPAATAAATYSLNLYTIDKAGAVNNIPASMPRMQPSAAAPIAAAEPGLTSAVQAPADAVPLPTDGVVPPKLPPPAVVNPGAYIAGTGFTVADPRPPTAQLTLTAPNWVKPKDAVKVSLKAESYVGSDVSEANVTIAWETGKAKGTLELTTDTSGTVVATRDIQGFACNRVQSRAGCD